MFAHLLILPIFHQKFLFALLLHRKIFFFLVKLIFNFSLLSRNILQFWNVRATCQHLIIVLQFSIAEQMTVNFLNKVKIDQVFTNFYLLNLLVKLEGPNYNLSRFICQLIVLKIYFEKLVIF